MEKGIENIPLPSAAPTEYPTSEIMVSIFILTEHFNIEKQRRKKKNHHPNRMVVPCFPSQQISLFSSRGRNQ